MKRGKMQEFVNDNMAEPLETNRQTRVELARILHYILRLLQSDYIDENIIDTVQYRLDWVYNTVVRYADLHVIDESVVRCIQLAKNCLQVDSNEGCSRFTVVRHMFNGGKRILCEYHSQTEEQHCEHSETHRKIQ